MARKGTGPRGEANVEDLTVAILRKIRGELVALRNDTAAGFSLVTGRLDHLTDRFDHLGARFDHLLDFTGDRYRDHERRIVKLERRPSPRRAT